MSEEYKNETGLSPGTDMALSTVKSFFEHRRDSRTTCISIDLSTLVRNLVSERGIEVPMQDVATEISLLSNQLAGVINSSNKRITVQFFMADYRQGIFPGTLRPLNEKTEAEHSLCQKILRTQLDLKGPSSSYKMEGVSFRIDLLGTPRVDITKWFLTTQSRMAIAPSVLCLTSSPIIWHAARKIPFVLIRSYAGGLLYRKEFARAAFGDPWADIPFYPCTHQVMGDKKLYASTLSIKEKKAIRTKAISENWSSRSEAFVNSNLKKLLKEIQ